MTEIPFPPRHLMERDLERLGEGVTARPTKEMQAVRIEFTREEIERLMEAVNFDWGLAAGGTVEASIDRKLRAAHHAWHGSSAQPEEDR
jgi:hypothetical protein